MKTLLLMCILLVSQSALANPYGEVALGFNITQYTPWSDGLDGGFAGPKDIIRLSAGYEKRPWFVQYNHISHLSSGWPIGNERTEDWIDMIEVGVRF